METVKASRADIERLIAWGCIPGPIAKPIGEITWAPLPPGVTEDVFQERVIEYARFRSWRVAHFRTVRVQRKDGSCYHATPVQADGEGFPDVVLVRDRIIFAELKRDKGTVKPDQREWIACLKAAGAEVYLWRPRDWQEIEEKLR